NMNVWQNTGFIGEDCIVDFWEGFEW
ncbi:MAG: hypothetical protein RLZZ578_1154, partial [Bacteroidota bacterium]